MPAGANKSVVANANCGEVGVARSLKKHVGLGRTILHGEPLCLHSCRHVVKKFFADAKVRVKTRILSDVAQPVLLVVEYSVIPQISGNVVPIIRIDRSNSSNTVFVMIRTVLSDVAAMRDKRHTQLLVKGIEALREKSVGCFVQPSPASNVPARRSEGRARIWAIRLPGLEWLTVRAKIVLLIPPAV